MVKTFCCIYVLLIYFISFPFFSYFLAYISRLPFVTDFVVIGAVVSYHFYWLCEILHVLQYSPFHLARVLYYISIVLLNISEVAEPLLSSWQGHIVTLNHKCEICKSKDFICFVYNSLFQGLNA